MFYSERAHNPAVPIPLTRWILTDWMKNPISQDEMTQGQMEDMFSRKFPKVTWRDWSKVLGRDRSQWVYLMMQDKPMGSPNSKASLSLGGVDSTSTPPSVKALKTKTEREKRNMGSSRDPCS